MGGSIGVESREGASSRFFFTLFLTLDGEAAKEQPPVSEFEGTRILFQRSMRPVKGESETVLLHRQLTGDYSMDATKTFYGFLDQLDLNDKDLLELERKRSMSPARFLGPRFSRCPNMIL